MGFRVTFGGSFWTWVRQSKAGLVLPAVAPRSQPALVPPGGWCAGSMGKTKHLQRSSQKKKWYPCCWHCGGHWLETQPQAQPQQYNTKADWEKWQSWARQYWTAWSQPKRQVDYPPGLGWTGAQMTPSEYEEAVASLWQDADPQAQKVLRACGIEPPKADTDADPRVTLHKYLAAYKSITQAHRSLVERKVQLQARADRIKTQFERALKELADVSKDIATAEDNLSKVQNQVQEQLKNAEPPEAKEVHDLQGLLKAAGVELSASQEGALSAYLHTRRDGRDHEEEEDGMEDPFQGLSGKIPLTSNSFRQTGNLGGSPGDMQEFGPSGCEATLCPARRRKKPES